MATDPNNINQEVIKDLDSNKKHIEWRKFWTINGSEKRFCGSLYKLEKILMEVTKIRQLKLVFVNVGVNDLDTKSPEKVSKQFERIIAILREKYEGIKIIVSEITPRKDAKDTEVVKCNTMLKTYGLYFRC